MRVLKLREGVEARELKRLYKRAGDRRTAQRLEAIYLRAKGKTPPEIAAIQGRHVDTVRTWIKLFNEGGAASLEYRHSGGRAGKLAKEHEERLAEWLKDCKPDGQRWKLNELAARLFEEFGIEISQQQISRRILGWGLGHLISRPRRKKPGAQSRRGN